MVSGLDVVLFMYVCIDRDRMKGIATVLQSSGIIGDCLVGEFSLLKGDFYW
jgi:hypothetical protein